MKIEKDEEKYEDYVDGIYNENINCILLNHQNIINNLYDQMNSILPHLQQEVEDVKKENIRLNNIIYEQEQQLKILNMKVYQNKTYSKSNYEELRNKYNIIIQELQRIDILLDLLQFKN